MFTLSTRARGFAPPPWRVWDAVTAERDAWLEPAPEEIAPAVVSSDRPGSVTLSSPWPSLPTSTLHVAILPDGAGSRVQVSLTGPLDEEPSAERATELKHRMNKLIHGDLRALLDGRRGG